jgi:uncharacterized protein (TIGR02271 family)
MDNTARQYNISEGTDIYGSDGDKVGSVVAVQPNYVVVEKGFFFPTDYYIPMSAIASEDDGKIYLSVTKDAALNQGWDAEPTADTYATTGGYTADMGSTTVGATDLAASTDMGAGADVSRSDAGYGAAADTTMETTRLEGTDTIRVPVHEEELTATKRQRQIGEVGIEKDVVEEQRTIEVPITEERVRVQRRAVDRAADASDTAFQEGTIEVPIQGEEVQLQKQTRVTEEIEIGKEAVQRTEQATGTVRREEVRVRENTNVDAGTTGNRVERVAGDAVDEGKGLLDRAEDAVKDTKRKI